MAIGPYSYEQVKSAFTGRPAPAKKNIGPYSWDYVNAAFTGREAPSGYGRGAIAGQGASDKAVTGYGGGAPTPAAGSAAHDSAYNMAADAAKKRKEDADSQFTYGLGTASSQYGLRANVDANTGQFSVAEMDPTSPDYNPFNQMAMLRQNFEKSKRGVKNRYAAQGQLYSGALQNAEDDTVEDYQRGYGRLSSGYADLIQGLISGRNNAYTSANEYLATAGGEELGRRAAAPAPAAAAAAPASAAPAMIGPYTFGEVQAAFTGRPADPPPAAAKPNIGQYTWEQVKAALGNAGRKNK